jgi:hypothetical protein
MGDHMINQACIRVSRAGSFVVHGVIPIVAPGSLFNVLNQLRKALRGA